jgi:hypothetical protein
MTDEQFKLIVNYLAQIHYQNTMIIWCMNGAKPHQRPTPPPQTELP